MSVHTTLNLIDARRAVETALTDDHAYDMRRQSGIMDVKINISVTYPAVYVELTRPESRPADNAAIDCMLDRLVGWRWERHHILTRPHGIAVDRFYLFPPCYC